MRVISTSAIRTGRPVAQVVPYMFDQNWTIGSENVDRCRAEGMENTSVCDDSQVLHSPAP